MYYPTFFFLSWPTNINSVFIFSSCTFRELRGTTYYIWGRWGWNGCCGTNMIHFIPFTHLEFYFRWKCVHVSTVCKLLSPCSMQFFLSSLNGWEFVFGNSSANDCFLGQACLQDIFFFFKVNSAKLWSGPSALQANRSWWILILGCLCLFGPLKGFLIKTQTNGLYYPNI